MVKFLTGKDPLLSQEEVYQAKKEKVKSTTGKNIISMN